MSKRRCRRQLKVHSGFDEEPMSLDSLHVAERLFAKLAVRWFLGGNADQDSAGLCLHRRAGRALTPQEDGPVIPRGDSTGGAESERERNHDDTRFST